MKQIKNILAAVALLALPMAFTSCDDILGEWDRPTPATNSAPTAKNVVYSFSLQDLAGTDITATDFKVTNQSGQTVVTASNDGKYTIETDDLGSATLLWLEATTTTAKYIVNVKVEELSSVFESGKLKMAAIGNVIGKDGKFYADKAAAETASTTAEAMIAYLGTAPAGGTGDATCTHGLAVAMDDVASNTITWNNSGTNNGGKTAVEIFEAWAAAHPVDGATWATWRIPSPDDWKYWFVGAGGQTYNSELSNASMHDYGSFCTKVKNAGATGTGVDGSNITDSHYWTNMASGYPSNPRWVYDFYNKKIFYTAEASADCLRGCLVF